MWVDDIEEQIHINGELTKETIDILSGGIVDFDSPTTLLGFLEEHRKDIHLNGVSRQDVGRLKAIPELRQVLVGVDENTYSATRSYCGIHTIISAIDIVINKTKGLHNED